MMVVPLLRWCAREDHPRITARMLWGNAHALHDSVVVLRPRSSRGYWVARAGGAAASEIARLCEMPQHRGGRCAMLLLARRDRGLGRRQRRIDDHDRHDRVAYGHTRKAPRCGARATMHATAAGQACALAAAPAEDLILEADARPP